MKTKNVLKMNYFGVLNIFKIFIHRQERPNQVITKKKKKTNKLHKYQ